MAVQFMPTVAEEVGLGDHVAFFFKSNAERLAFVIPYIVRGLKNRERCIYITHENTTADILAAFRNAGIDTEEAAASEALSVVTTNETYLRDGIFDPQKMIADLDHEVRSAIKRGFLGIRVTGEMSWALDLPSALSRLCEYEKELRHSWPALLGGLCQYNESLFPADVVARMAGCHDVVVRDGNVIRHEAHKTAAQR